MINWRNGKGGFVGGLKHLIKSVFQYAHTITTATIIIREPASFAVQSLIDSNGSSVMSSINANGLSVPSTMLNSFGVQSIIREGGQGLLSSFDQAGQSTTGKMQG